MIAQSSAEIYLSYGGTYSATTIGQKHHEYFLQLQRGVVANLQFTFYKNIKYFWREKNIDAPFSIASKR